MHEWLQDLASALGNAEVWQALGRVLTKFALSEALQYVGITFALWFMLHVLLRKRLAHRLISGWPRAGEVRREMWYFACTLVIYVFGSAALLGALALDKIEVYADPLKHGLPWLLLSLPVMLVWQDACYYLSHRLLHTRWLFRHVHAVHHRSREPSPWAGFSNHPLESMLTSGLPLVLLAFVPVQQDVLLLYVLHQVTRTAHGHAAVEVYPRGFARHRFWGHFTSTTHHHLHHESVRGNYGLWFTWWDRLLGTENEHYLQRYDAATAPRPAVAQAAASEPARVA